MWKPRKLTRMNAIVFEPSPHGRRFLTENLYRMALTRISHVFDPTELATSIHQLDFRLIFIDWGNDRALRDELFQVVQEWSRVREFSQMLIMTTPDGRESNLKMAMVLDCDAIILKPYSPRIFCDRVIWAVRRKEEYA
jgi:DNA-binding response OmpR family regulator